jgi:hypothetical protein
MESLSSYFGKRLTETQQDYYFNELKFIPEPAFDHAVKTIQKTRKPTQGNFPTIEEIQGLCPIKTTGPAYNPNETLDEYYKRITIQHLWTGLRILQGQGKDSFERYCRTNHISDEDAERIKYRLRVSNAQEHVRKLTEKIG